MKIGLLCCFFDCEEMLYEVIHPWLQAKDDGNDMSIAVSYGMFKEYKEFGYEDNDEKTLDLIRGGNWHDFLYVQPKDVLQTEAEIRNHSLQKLLEEKCDIIILLDGDEVFTLEEVENIIRFVEDNEFITWFDIEFKNLTFSGNTYTKGFRPPRVFRVNSGDFKLDSIYWDNDMSYLSKDGNKITYKDLSKKSISTDLVNPLHHTWLNNERSRKKIQYQEEHFKNGAGCSFKWSENGLEWDEEYFIKTGREKPELHKI
jgi:hypothetical protein